MKNVAGVKSLGVALVLSGVALSSIACRKADVASSPDPAPPASEGQSTLSSLKLQTGAFQDGATIPTEYSCSGAGTSPPLSWSGVPPKAKSLALLVTDPDAPAGTWTHWILWNLPPSTTSLPADLPPEEKLPSGARQGQNSGGGIGYTPPCPPPGKPHRYVFTLYALDRDVDLSRTPITEYSTTLRAHAVAQGRIIGIFGR